MEACKITWLSYITRLFSVDVNNKKLNRFLVFTHLRKFLFFSLSVEQNWWQEPNRLPSLLKSWCVMVWSSYQKSRSAFNIIFFCFLFMDGRLGYCKLVAMVQWGASSQKLCIPTSVNWKIQMWLDTWFVLVQEMFLLFIHNRENILELMQKLNQILPFECQHSCFFMIAMCNWLKSRTNKNNVSIGV